MPRMIASYEKVRIISVSKISEMEYNDWRWREDLVGQMGSIEVFEVSKKLFKKHYAVFDSDNNYYLSTGCGEAQITEDRIDLQTTNSRYVFQIIQAKDTESETSPGKEHPQWPKENS